MKQLWKPILFVSVTGIFLSTLTASEVAPEASRVRRNSDSQVSLSSQNSGDEAQQGSVVPDLVSDRLERLEQQYEALERQGQQIKRLSEQLEKLQQQEQVNQHNTKAEQRRLEQQRDKEVSSLKEQIEKNNKLQCSAIDQLGKSINQERKRISGFSSAQKAVNKRLQAQALEGKTKRTEQVERKIGQRFQALEATVAQRLQALEAKIEQMKQEGLVQRMRALPGALGTWIVEHKLVAGGAAVAAFAAMTYYIWSKRTNNKQQDEGCLDCNNDGWEDFSSL